MGDNAINKTVLGCYPEVEAIYLFGTYGTDEAGPKSDADIALLFPPARAKAIGNLAFGPCCLSLMDLLKKEVDLINLQMVNTVFQHEIIQNGRIIYGADENTVDHFEMNVMSAYQKLNEERVGILEEIYRSGRILDV